MADNETKDLGGNAMRVGPVRLDHDDERILSLELRASKLGFAVLRGKTLLDWGVVDCRHARHGGRLIRRRLGELLAQHSPAFIVLRKRSNRPARVRHMTAAMSMLVRREAKRRNIPVHVTDAGLIRKFFATRGCRNKYDVGVVLTTSLDMGWNLPKKRKPWDGESYVGPIFDAAATGASFWELKGPEEHEA